MKFAALGESNSPGSNYTCRAWLGDASRPDEPELYNEGWSAVACRGEVVGRHKLKALYDSGA